MSDSTPNSGLFGGVRRQPRLSDRVAEDIIDTIVTQRLKPGDSLPAERELGEQFGVSRTVIREAVRALDARGLLDVRVGSRIRVAAVDPRTVHDAIWHFVRTSGLEEAAIAAVADVLDVAAARMAAEVATERDLELIDRAAETVDGLAFRRAVVAASHNELLAVVVDAVAALAGAPGQGGAGADGHRAVAAAIARRDPEAAERAMRERFRQAG